MQADANVVRLEEQLTPLERIKQGLLMTRNKILHAEADAFEALMEHGRWWVTDAGWQVLKGPSRIELRKDLRAGASAKAQRREKRVPAVVVGEADAALLASLKALRSRLAQEQRVPAYVVFSDRTLVEFASHRPESPRAMREIHGVGDAKLECYGTAFLEVIRSAKAT